MRRVELFDQSLWSVQENRAIKGERLREWKSESVPSDVLHSNDFDMILDRFSRTQQPPYRPHPHPTSPHPAPPSPRAL